MLVKYRLSTSNFFPKLLSFLSPRCFYDSWYFSLWNWILRRLVRWFHLLLDGTAQRIVNTNASFPLCQHVHCVDAAAVAKVFADSHQYFQATKTCLFFSCSFSEKKMTSFVCQCWEIRLKPKLRLIIDSIKQDQHIIYRLAHGKEHCLWSKKPVPTTSISLIIRKSMDSQL